MLESGLFLSFCVKLLEFGFVFAVNLCSSLFDVFKIGGFFHFFKKII